MTWNVYDMESRILFSIVFAWVLAIMPFEEKPDILGGGHAAEPGQLR